MSISYIIMLVGASILLVGLITTMAAPDDGNVTPVDNTIHPAITEAPAPIEPPAEVQEEELTTEEQMAIREGEMAEEAALTEEETVTEEVTEEVTGSIGEPIIEDVNPMPVDPMPVDPMPVHVQVPVEAAGQSDNIINTKSIFVETTDNIPAKETKLKRIVNRSGFVYVGTEYADKEVTISI